MKFLSIFLSAIILFSCGGGSSSGDGGITEGGKPKTSSQTQQEWRGTWKYISGDENIHEFYIEIMEASLSSSIYSYEYECLDEGTPETDFSFTDNSIAGFDDELQENIEVFVSVEGDILNFSNSDGTILASYQRSDTSSLTLCSENTDEGLIRFEIKFDNLPSSIPVKSNSGVSLEISLDIDNSSSSTDGDLWVNIDFGNYITYDNLTDKDLTDLVTAIYSCYEQEAGIRCNKMAEDPLIDINLENKTISIIIDKSAHIAFNEVSATTQFYISAWHYYTDNESNYHLNNDTFGYTPIIDAYNATDPLNDYSGDMDTFDIIEVSAMIDHAEATTQDQ